MAITENGIIISYRKRRGIGFFAVAFLELVLSMVLVVSLSANLIFPQQTQAGAGISQKLSYQGRLTDLSGNTLGGATGTNYCFRFSIYDAPSGGNKVWPSGTPTSETVKVKDGAFATAIGNSASLSYDFTALKSSYLNVEVNTTPTTCAGTWENLDVRQRIDAVAYARAAELVYGDLLRVASGSGVVQIGTGSGSSTPIYLGLDQKNVVDAVDTSCSNNGQIWYTAAGKNRFRVCQGSTIRDMVDGILVKYSGANIGRASVALDFAGAGVTVVNNGDGVISVNVPFAGIAAGGSTVSSGSIVFSNANGVSFGFNGSTITGSVNAAGGGGTMSFYENLPFFNSTTQSVGQSVSAIQPFILPQAISASFVRFPILMTTNSTTIGTTANTTFSAGLSSTINVVVYSMGTGANSKSLQYVVSGSAGVSEQWSLQANANGSQYTQSYFVSYPVSGAQTNYTTQTSVSQTNFSFATASLTQFSSVRFLDVPFATSLSAGNYWLMYGISTNSGAQVAAATNLNVRYSNNYAVSQPNLTIASMGQAAAGASVQMLPGVGSFSTNGAGGTTNSLAFSNISSSASHIRAYFQIFRQG